MLNFDQSSNQFKFINRITKFIEIIKCDQNMPEGHAKSEILVEKSKYIDCGVNVEKVGY